MGQVAAFLVGLVAVEHIYFMILEMFLWNTPKGRKAFGMTEEFASTTAVLAKNQGLYNGFLAAGLVWSFFAPEAMALPLSLFFLSCIVIAGVFGGLTVNKKIAVLQAGPAFIALILKMLER
ncbi:MAG: DUF1304 domain-containing protein [Bacillota bacterium]